MGIYLADQTVAFLHACLLGAVLGALYDLFRILRIAFPAQQRTVVFVQDVLYWLLCAVATFLFLLSSIDGAVRVFLILGEALGWILYYCTLGQLVMKVSTGIIHAVQAVLRFVVRYLFLPVWRLFYNIISLLLRPFRYFGRIIRNCLQRLRFRLKVRRIVLYNQTRGYLRKRIPAKKVREKQTDEPKKEP